MKLTETEEHLHIVVIGTSAGGISALQELVSQLHDGMNAAFFIVMHLSQKGISDFLVHKLQQVAQLPCALAREGAPIQKGHIYIAPADKHLLVAQEGIKFGYGPKENRWKPAIDMLFRSAAAAFDGRTIGIILTGYLNDGTSGMLAIKNSGGTCIVQDPNEAEYPDMPLSVLEHLQADYCVRLSKMGDALEMALQLEKEETAVPEHVLAEAAIAERAATGIDKLNSLGENSIYSCPDCGGVLFNIQENSFSHYRCHTGHSFTVKDLLLRQEQEFESTLWVALRSLEERKTLLHTLENQNTSRGFQLAAKGYAEKAEELQEHIDRLRRLLVSAQNDDKQKAASG
ncbi:chemotaxis protein CheB [Cesiribacter sp. SM1]|uniref:chemotaxis protein CheB n=1 Tax=Cesiribacter sp. SM1 TaxID=2861196 RepID=UPI001CD76FB8|nr:chemotaxis protein CheB [Cesiribacter sp. SM1]